MAVSSLAGRSRALGRSRISESGFTPEAAGFLCCDAEDVDNSDGDVDDVSVVDEAEFGLEVDVGEAGGVGSWGLVFADRRAASSATSFFFSSSIFPA